MTKPKLLFLSSSNFGAQVLQDLADLKADILLVTSEDKSKGRGLNLQPNSAKKIAQDLGLEVVEVANKTEVAQILKQKDYDLALIAGFSYIIQADVLFAPKTKLKHLVLHPSLLPDLRGASPIQYALLKGYKKTGICLFEIEASVDSGDVIACENLAIDKNDNYKTLEIKLARQSAKLFKENYSDYLAGKIESKPQKGKVSFTKQIEKTDGRVNFKKETAREIFNKFRAFYIWPGIYFELNYPSSIKTIKITDLALKNKKLLIKKVLPEGKKEMDFQSFLNGYNFPLDLQNKIIYPK
ncbi:MAG: methionyl-tRNA formyltransferase [Patescibacteria group bacterium]|nr:methionyl-tRNA formyltransferase [Patescibacteria group bacterium]